jgi:hypothetical protein
VIDSREVASALPWLHGKLKLDTEVNLYYLLGNMRLNQHHYWYKKWEVASSDGSKRVIHSPQGNLRLVQERINQYILSAFSRHPNSYGYMGGSCFESDQKHLGYKSVLMFDIKHAFPNTTHQMVFDALHNNSFHREPYLSFFCSRFVADFCTVGNIERCDEVWENRVSYGGQLPQGSPTSPKLFDLCMRKIDDDMAVLADRYYLTYTRYADNFYFSSAFETEFPDLPRNIILSKVRKLFPVHKIKQVSHGDMCRMLGLNASPYRITNTRDFKRKLKGALHHLEYMLNSRVGNFEPAWSVVRGLAGFAVIETLPPKLRDKLHELNQEAHLQSSGW